MKEIIQIDYSIEFWIFGGEKTFLAGKEQILVGKNENFGG